MIMFFISISEFQSYWYLSAAFQFIVGCFSIGLLIVGITCTGLVVFTGFSASWTIIIADLAASVAVCVIACNMLCSAAILFF